MKQAIKTLVPDETYTDRQEFGRIPKKSDFFREKH
jgi:hypothetical protein